MARRRPAPAPAEGLVNTPADLRAFNDELSRCPVVGLDTEFVGEESYRPELCLVQVSTPGTLVVIDPYTAGDLATFWDLLTDPGRTTIVHAGREEVRMCRHAIGRTPSRVFDLQIAAALVGYNYPIGYSGLVQEVLNARASKAETLTDWRRRPLTANQVRYAYDDVRYLIEIFELFTERLAKLKRQDWADEEFASAVARAVNDDPAVEKFRKLKGLGGLSRRELGIARELYVWRDTFASRLNRPPRVLMRDDVVIEIARRGSTRPDDLSTLRGVPRGETENILAAIERGAAMPAADLPAAGERDHDPAHVSTLANLLGVVLVEFSTRMKLAPNLVATQYDLKSLVRERQPGGKPAADSVLNAGWRAAHVRPHLDAVLDGSQAIRVSDPASPAPVSVHPIAARKPA